MEPIYKINTSENNPKLRLSTVEDVLRDPTITTADKHRVLKCYKYVKQWVEWSGDEPINGNDCITVDGVFRAIKVHANQTISHVKVLTGQRNNYVKLQISPQVTP